MFFIILIILLILFIAVFAYIFWRILMSKTSENTPEAIPTYVCPHCNAMDCECHQVEDAE